MFNLELLELRRCRRQAGAQNVGRVGPWGDGELAASVQTLPRAKVVWESLDWALLALLLAGLGWLLLPLVPLQWGEARN